MWAPVSDAARTSSSAPSMRAVGAKSTRSRTCVYVGTPDVAASRATRRDSAGRVRGPPRRRGEPRHAQVLGGAGAGRIPDEHADAEAARGQLVFEEPEDAVLVGGGGLGLPAGAGEAGAHA